MLVTPFAREIRRLRTLAGWTVRELAEMLGKSFAYVAKIESRGEIPSLDTVLELATVLRGDADILLQLAKEARIESAARGIELAYALPRSTAVQTRTYKQRKPMTATVLSLINMKGGVGKTTLAMHLAHAADQRNFRTLAVDLDPQSNLSQAILRPKRYAEHIASNKPTVVQIFEDYFPSHPNNSSKPLDVESVIIKKAGFWKDTTLDLIPSRLELCRTLKNPYGKERQLALALSQVSEKYDLIIIDCAPTESVLTDAAYFASRYIVVPIKPEFLATIGLPLLARSMHDFKIKNAGHPIDIAGLVFCHSSSYSSGPEGRRSVIDVTKEAQKHGWHLCQNQLTYSASYAKSAREGTPISSTSYTRWDVKAGFRQLADEIFGLVGATEALV